MQVWRSAAQALNSAARVLGITQNINRLSSVLSWLTRAMPLRARRSLRIETALASSISTKISASLGVLRSRCALTTAAPYFRFAQNQEKGKDELV
jgi:hypothetical protein